jgi:hypothetical protein
MYSFTLSEVMEKIYDGTVACNVGKTDGNYTLVTVYVMMYVKFHQP